VTGGVLSQIARIDRVLPSNSMYIPIKEDYERRTKHSQEVGMSADLYAKQVVSKLLVRSPPRNIWAGYGVNLVWFALTFLPSSILVCRHVVFAYPFADSPKGHGLQPHVQFMEASITECQKDELSSLRPILADRKSAC